TGARLLCRRPAYVGLDQRRVLTDAIRKTPHALLLLDEIEKAHPDLFNILLQVMDHATLTDHTGRKADFRHVILIMTTNAGAHEMAAAAIGFGDPSNKDKGKKALERLFAPEFRNRLDAVVEFGALTPEAVERVVDKFITELDAQLLARRVTVQLTPAARQWLAERGYDKTFGARPMARLIQTEIKRVLADEMLFGQLRDGGRVEIDAGPGGLAFRSAPLRGAVPVAGWCARTRWWPWRCLLLLAVGLGYLVFNLSFRVRDGGLWTAGNGCEDMGGHATFANAFLHSHERILHPTYSIFPSWPLGYPFLADFAAATAMAMGSSIGFGFFATAAFALLALLSNLYGLARRWLPPAYAVLA